ncbi:Fic family protein [Salmonella enterica]|nr:Fic family protein [Salmonella enterica]EJX3102660.1 Fic family protein [Salmonella enterica]EJX3112780.1 Fic family protein [Salmonella enterica]EJX3251014.1 Fic family protein [Salmonella enterica]EJX3461820.1 Fic family protein [Salmonella enterica]
MPIKRPPPLIPYSQLTEADLEAHQHYSRVTDDKGRYLPFDEFCRRTARGENVSIAWTLTRRARDSAMQWINYRNEAGEQAGFVLTPGIMSVCELVDKHATRLALKELTTRLRGAGKELTALSLEEPITSSQLEGANTTTLVARNMLESGRAPRTEDEHMIAGNARLMAEIPELIQEPLTPDLIRRFHAVGMGGINDEKYRPGEFRDTDDVVIADYDGNIIHQPPAAADLPERLQIVCDFVNDTEHYVHPLVKACILHFMIAHEHPFRDGNGRTSRGLFYWYMLKSGYDVFKYVSISHLLHTAPAKYAHSYQYTETDGMDLTYYLEYQTSIIHRAMTRLLQHVDDLVSRAARIDHFLYQSGSLSRLSGRQITLLNIILAEPGKKYSAAIVAEMLGVSDNTARNDLRTLARENLLTEISENDQKTVYRVSQDLS